VLASLGLSIDVLASLGLSSLSSGGK